MLPSRPVGINGESPLSGVSSPYQADLILGLQRRSITGLPVRIAQKVTAAPRVTRRRRPPRRPEPAIAGRSVAIPVSEDGVDGA